MPSLSHQWLLLWVARKMKADGMTIRGYEGPTPQGGSWNALSRPFEIGGVRPDAWAIDPKTGEIAIGEAKTAADLDNEHTLRQVRVFANLMQRIPQRLARLYIAVPWSAAGKLDRLLARAGGLQGYRIVRLHIPDCLVEGAHELS